MPGSRASVFGDAEDFEEALRAEGVTALLVTGPGQFRARLTQIALDRLRLSAVEEGLPRVACVSVPADKTLVAFPIDGEPTPIWGAVEIRAGEMITLGPGQRCHARTVGPCYWGAIQVSTDDLGRYGRILSGLRFLMPPAARWRPRPAAARHLGHLHRAAIRMAEARSRALADFEAVHGLEQQLLHALIECLSGGVADEETPAARRHRDLVARFEDLLVAEPSMRMAEMCIVLGASDRFLRECCKAQLGMSPSLYRRRRRMQQLHRTLRSANPDIASVTLIAGSCGFRGLGRLATHYRAAYGELPSVTLRRAFRPGMTQLAIGRPRTRSS